MNEDIKKCNENTHSYGYYSRYVGDDIERHMIYELNLAFIIELLQEEAARYLNSMNGTNIAVYLEESICVNMFKYCPYCGKEVTVKELGELLEIEEKKKEERCE